MATQQTAVSSKQFTLSSRDWWIGLLMAVGGAVVRIIYDVINSGSWDFDWKQIGIAAAGAAITYLAKNFFDKPKVVLLNPTDQQVDLVKEGDAKLVVQRQ